MIPVKVPFPTGERSDMIITEPEGMALIDERVNGQ